MIENTSSFSQHNSTDLPYQSADLDGGNLFGSVAHRPSPFCRSGSTMRSSPFASSSTLSDSLPAASSLRSSARTSGNPFRRSLSSIFSNGDEMGANDNKADKQGRHFLASRRLNMHASPTRTQARRNISITTDASTVRPPIEDRRRLAPRLTSFRDVSDPHARIPPTLLNSMHEYFDVLDPNNKGTVTPEDIQEARASVGLDNDPASVTRYFLERSQPLSRADFLNMMASLLGPMTRESRLLAAFEAFDVQDDGQISIDELLEALIDIPAAPGERTITRNEVDRIVADFRDRRTLNKMARVNIGREDVFLYKEFVANVCGGVLTKDANGGLDAA